MEALSEQSMNRDEIREYLNPIYDLERLLGKVSYKSANPRDLIAFRNSLQMLPHIKTLLTNFNSALLTEINEEIDDLSDICTLIENSILDEPPITIREGESSKMDLMRILIPCAMPRQKGRTGLLNWKKKTGSGQGLKI